jgi:excisionase family DNA binding protein
MVNQMTLDELLALPVSVDLATAARALGIGRSTSYELIRRGEFPCRVLRLGNSYRIPRADLFLALGMDPAGIHTPATESNAAVSNLMCTAEIRDRIKAAITQQEGAYLLVAVAVPSQSTTS